jgi:hypothetical protein
MTNKERLISLLGFTPDHNSIDGELLDAGITGAATYDGSEKDGIRTCAINLIELLLTTPDQTSDNGFKVIYDRKAVMEKLGILKGETGETLVKRNIQRANFW